MQSLRQGYPHMNISDIRSKVLHHYLYIKRDITVQKIKVIK